MSEAVLDAGPLIHLSELDALDVLRDMDILRVPVAVWDEASTHQPEALEFPGLERVTVPNVSASLQIVAQSLALDRGELEALSLMELYPRALFLTDDAAARLAAEQRGYAVHGTIGLLIRAVRRGLRSAPEILSLLRVLPQRSTLHLRSSLLNAILARLENEWTK